MDTTIALHKIVNWLACPICGQRFLLTDRKLVCPNHHSYDLARQGYVNLLGRTPPPNADTSAMLSAREKVFDSGIFNSLRDQIQKAVGQVTSIVEVGAGTGFYLSGILDAKPDAAALATDVSVAAARKCAANGLAAIVADTWRRLPLTNSCVAAVLCVFAPRNPAEFARILIDHGRVIVAAPNLGHLLSLRNKFGLLDIPDNKQERITASFTQHGFSLVSTHEIVSKQSVDESLVANLIAMGPNAFHQHTRNACATQVELDVSIKVFELEYRN